MRKVVLYTLMALDGAVDHPDRYFAPVREGGEVPEFDSVMLDNENKIIEAQDTVLLGRRMYDEWSRYWPTSDEQPYADFINNVTKYVVTSSPLTTEWSNSEAVAGPVEDLVRDLKARPGGDIGVHGSIALAQSMLEAGLVDELQLVVGPAFGCTGRRLFEGMEQTRRLELLSVTPTPSSSVLPGLPRALTLGTCIAASEPKHFAAVPKKARWLRSERSERLDQPDLLSTESETLLEKCRCRVVEWIRDDDLPPADRHRGTRRGGRCCAGRGRRPDRRPVGRPDPG